MVNAVTLGLDVIARGEVAAAQHPGGEHPKPLLGYGLTRMHLVGV
jgi:hypothetical protein